MKTPANDHNKPSPSDTPTEKPADNGHQSVTKREDNLYHADEPEQENIAKKYEQEEQPVNSVKNPPKENQPDVSDDNDRRLESK